MVAHAQAEPGRRNEIIKSILRLTRLAHSMIQDSYQGYLSHGGDHFDPLKFGLARAHELSTTLQWLHENVTEEDQPVIWETMDLLWTGAKIGLRYMAQKYRMNHDEQLARQTREAVDMAFQYHGTPSGSITSDEFLGGLIDVFSLSWLHRLFGDNDYADRTELAAFNARPGGISPDWWTHQYVTQSNQPWIKRLNGRPFCDVSPYGNILGLEPDYPCCLVNHHQGLPKLICSAFVQKGSNWLIHRFLIPAEISTELDGSHVSIMADTHYPFGPLLPVQSFSRVFTTNRQPWSEIRIVNRPSSSAVSIYWGSLLYALDIEYTETSTPSTHWKKNVDPLPEDPRYPQLRDRTLVPAEGAEWRVAIDPSQIAIYWSSQDTDPASAPPMVLLIAAIRIAWPVRNGAAHGVPKEIITESEPFVAGFVLFASAPLHMAELPTISLDKLNLSGHSP
ncbi:hypothetical protein BDV23DRAFT_171284 [Aspergillus alliaceus]|uniref:Uncharacterized protein n=1 Tax=Petromyces alliaceus TaxID=209559 RepID=A0A5N7CEA5_PETAA|nr:hypothetical protein BDV23DRAFT_171284 [Aspergillus alliaceus]